MSDTVIRVENLGKRYRIGLKEKAPKTLRQAMTGLIGAPFQYLQTVLREPTPEEIIWALKDVSFEVKQGEVVGILGRNGAGKSTLLKILSQITEPTSGYAEIRGRVGSLLEVGTGFHPDLTGRENTYLNGTILGMKKREIDRCFDQIVAFAEVEKFIDTPVKFYSSGMYTRLAFAVAAHLQPEILIVDEVLAVGDIQFQEKCLGKMGDVAAEGRTVLFVSHNISAIRALSTRGILLNQGQVVANDSIDNAISYYRGNQVSLTSSYTAPEKLNKPYFEKVEIYQTGSNSNIFAINKKILVKFQIESYGVKELVIGVFIRNIKDVTVHHSTDEFRYNNIPNDTSRRECELPSYALAPGKYYLDVFLGKRNVEVFDGVTNILGFEVEFVGKMSNCTPADEWKGICGPGLLIWR
ncbi:MAG: polysaccharide ABC transporter ATP-binding protein [Cyanobacteriota bacterium]